MKSILAPVPDGRIQWIDVVKFLCIMFVMMSHLESNTPFANAFYYPFFLSGFFFASGYVYRHKSNFKSFFIHKVKGLFVPWLIFSIFNILVAQIISFNKHGNLWEELKWNFLQIRGLKDGVWFVAAIFVAFIPFYFVIEWYEKSKKKRVGLLITVLVLLYAGSVAYSYYMNPQLLPWGSAALPWHIEYLPQAVLFMTLGYLFKGPAEKRFDQYNTLPIFIGFTLFYLAFIYIPFGFQLQFPAPLQLFYDHISKFLGTVLLVLACKRIKTNSYFAFVGGNTLVYFALHGKVYGLVEPILSKVAYGPYNAILNNTVASTLFAIAFTIGITLVLMPVIFVINKWFPFVVGRKRK